MTLFLSVIENQSHWKGGTLKGVDTNNSDSHRFHASSLHLHLSVYFVKEFSPMHFNFSFYFVCYFESLQICKFKLEELLENIARFWGRG